MHKGSDKPGAHRRIVWFDIGASVLFVTVGVLLSVRGLWHTLIHHELMLRSVIGGVLFCAVGSLFAIQGLKAKRLRQRKSRGKIRKRHRTVKRW